MDDWKQSDLDHRDFQHIKTDGVIPHRSKKDTKRWCKGKQGNEHKPAIVKISQFERFAWSCNPASWHGCFHHEVCSVCGKELRYSIDPSECPDRKETS